MTTFIEVEGGHVNLDQVHGIVYDPNMLSIHFAGPGDSDEPLGQIVFATSRDTKLAHTLMIREIAKDSTGIRFINVRNLLVDHKQAWADHYARVAEQQRRVEQEAEQQRRVEQEAAKKLHALIMSHINAVPRTLSVANAREMLTHFNVTRVKDLTHEQAVEGKAMVEKMLETVRERKEGAELKHADNWFHAWSGPGQRHGKILPSNPVLTAIRKLDPDVDSHWVMTGAYKGRPKLQAVEDAYRKNTLTRQDIELTRQDIEAAAPGYNRLVAIILRERSRTPIPDDVAYRTEEPEPVKPKKRKVRKLETRKHPHRGKTGIRYLHQAESGKLRFRRYVPQDLHGVLAHTGWNFHFPAGTSQSVIRRTVALMVEQSNREIADARKAKK